MLNQSTSRGVALANALLAVLFASAEAWFIYIAYAAAAEAVRVYGTNVDSGAILWLFGVYLLTPAVIVFAMAGVSFWWRWRTRWPRA